MPDLAVAAEQVAHRVVFVVVEEVVPVADAAVAAVDAAFAAEHGFNFPYVIDRTQEVARAYDAVCTPDFFGFNAAGELQYRGRLDESKMTLIEGARRELYEAMVQTARTGKGPADQTPSMGCSIKWKA